MANTTKPTIETGVLTLVLLVRYYKSQMVALLLKNGVTVPNGASDQQIAMLMANLLKVSKSFFTDLNNFIQNPKVLQTLAGGVTQTAQYFKMSGNAQYFRASGFAGKKQGNAQYFRASGYMNSDGGEDGFTDTGASTPTGTTPPKSGFFSNLNLGNLFTQAIGAFGSYTKAQSDAEIARQHALAEQAKAEAVKAGSDIYVDPSTGEKVKVKDDTKDTGMSTTTIVVLSLVGVALLGTVIYFVARPKSS